MLRTFDRSGPAGRFLAPVRPMAFALTLCAAAACAAAAQEGWSPVAEGFPRTTAETSGFEEYTPHLDMWGYLEGLRANSTEMRLGVYGETREGRRLPYAVFSRPMIAEPWEAWTLERPVLVLAANVHGGERTFREGLLVLMRDLATPGTGPNALLDDVVVVVVPQVNPDGFEATPRGQRGNAWGIDLNRDYVKLEHPSIADYIGNVIGAWRPHLFIDGHNGGSYPYNLAYQCTSAHDPDPALTAVCDDEIFEAIDARLEGEGFRSFYYTGGDEQEWRTGGWQARIGRNYGGFANSVAILFEAPGGQTLAEGARAGYLGYLAVVEWAARNADHLRGIVRDARVATLQAARAGGEVAVQQEYEAEDEPVEYDIVVGDWRSLEEGEEPELMTVTDGRLMKKPVATATRTRPYAYLLPRDAEAAVALLRRHGITVERLTRDTELDVQAYTVGDIRYERAYNHASAVRVQVGEVVSRTETFPRGTWVVSTEQMLGRLVAHMLEVETDDNVIYWNTMDAWLPRPDAEAQPDRGAFTQSRESGPPLVPIFKLMQPRPLATEMVEGG